jgi:hypothetical protein
LDESTFKRLINSEHSSPQITDVVYDINQMEKLILNSVNITHSTIDSVLDKTMFNFISNCLQEGFAVLDNLIEERNIKIRTIIEITLENIELVNSIKHYEIKHVENLRGFF